LINQHAFNEVYFNKLLIKQAAYQLIISSKTSYFIAIFITDRPLLNRHSDYFSAYCTSCFCCTVYRIKLTCLVKK